MALTLRATKGAKLTNAEADANLSGLASGANMTLPFNIGNGKFALDASGNAVFAASVLLEYSNAFGADLRINNTVQNGKDWLFRSGGASGTGGAGCLEVYDLTANQSRAIFISAGACKFTTDGTYRGVTDNYHELRSNNNGEATLRVTNKHSASPFGMTVEFSSAAPDNNTNYFFLGTDNLADRILIDSDGDLRNHDNSYGAISGAYFKQDARLSSSQWDDVKALARQVKKYRMRSDVEAYGDAAQVQLGLVAEDVLPISPGLVRPFRNGLRMDYSLQYSILYMKGFKALGEVMERQERSESRLTRIEQTLGLQ